MPHQFYSEDEAEEILRLAARQQFNGGVTRDALLRMASEVGLSEEEVAAAEARFRTSNDEQELAHRFAMRQRAKFVTEALSYVGINAFMVAVWWMSGRGYFWPGWVFAGTFLGAFEAIPKQLMPASAPYQRAFEKWKAKGAPAIDPEEEGEEEDHSHRHRGLTIGVVSRRGHRRKRRSE